MGWLEPREHVHCLRVVSIVHKDAHLLQWGDRLCSDPEHPLYLVIHYSERPVHDFAQVERPVALRIRRVELDYGWHIHQMRVFLSEDHLHFMAFEVLASEQICVFVQFDKCCIGDCVLVEAQSYADWPSDRLVYLPEGLKRRICYLEFLVFFID